MTLVNSAFYRATRETAFNLSLSVAQIEAMIRIRRNVEQHNRDVDFRLQRAEHWKSQGLDHFLEKLPDFAPEGDPVPRNDCLVGTSATVNCLASRGLITSHEGRTMFTEAGWLVYQLLHLSGHIQEIDPYYGRKEPCLVKP